jgi:hypothetical protein
MWAVFPLAFAFLREAWEMQSPVRSLDLRFVGALVSLIVGLWGADSALAQGPVSLPPRRPGTMATRPAPLSGVAQLRAESRLLAPLGTSEQAKAFLGATAHLPSISPRVLHMNREKRQVLTPEQFEQLPPPPATDRDGFTPRDYNETFYYSTGYGSPLVYARLIDLAASRYQLQPWSGLKALDFGYGAIGHLRLMASLGADVHGLEIEPLFKALYSAPGDTGSIARHDDPSQSGRLTLHHGQWPADAALAQAIAQSGPFDLITSKNTLKRGYIHPEREADPSKLIELGVSDETFVKAVYDAIKPGGLLVIYNISPAPAPADKPYMPWADGRCPFDRELCEKAGFEILAWDEDDQPAILDWWKALGNDQGKIRERLATEIFALFTVMRKPTS